MVRYLANLATEEIRPETEQRREYGRARLETSLLDLDPVEELAEVDEAEGVLGSRPPISTVEVCLRGSYPWFASGGDCCQYSVFGGREPDFPEGSAELSRLRWMESSCWQSTVLCSRVPVESRCVLHSGDGSKASDLARRSVLERVAQRWSWNYVRWFLL